MNREILFRGKQVDNDEWTEGYYTELPCGSLGATIFSNDDELVCEDAKSYIIEVFTKQHTNYSNSNPLQVVECEKYEVIPETVGQYTGLTDKNGKKIFEGDILRGFAYPFRDGEGKHNYYAEVVWFENSPAFGLVTHKNPKSNVVGISDGNCEYMEDWETFLWEVIGNIYDNPELLEAEND